MRGSDAFTESLLSRRYLYGFVPYNHPLRPVLNLVNLAPKSIEFLHSKMRAADIKGSRPSVEPENCRAPYCFKFPTESARSAC